MADKKYGRVTEVTQVQDDTRLLTLQLEEPDSIEFIGGQYVIIHSEAEIEPGKAAKGTFTIISPEAQTDRIRLAVKQIGEGPCTKWLNQAVKVGDRIGYSGPWGAKNYESAIGDVDALFVATDTGINAVLGFLNSRNAAACLPRARVLWLVPSENYFLAPDFVRRSLPAAVRERFRVEFISEPATPERPEQAVRIVEEELQQLTPRYTLLTGDGDVITALQALLMERGLGANVTIEPYFHKPQKPTEVKKNSAPGSRPEPAQLPPRKPQRTSS